MAARKGFNVSSSKSSSGVSKTPVSTAATSSPMATVDTVSSSAERTRRKTQFTVPLFSGRKLPRGSDDRDRGRQDVGIQHRIYQMGRASVAAVPVGVALQEGAYTLIFTGP